MTEGKTIIRIVRNADGLPLLCLEPLTISSSNGVDWLIHFLECAQEGLWGSLKSEDEVANDPPSEAQP